MFPTILLTITALSTLLASVTASPTVFLIRHGEKEGAGNYLNATGLKRSQCLVNVFSQSQYNIGYILAEHRSSDGSHQRPYDTVLPFAQHAGLNINESCHKTDSACVQQAVASYQGPGNILICWEHSELTNIAAALGMKNAPQYPDCRFDLIWTDPSPHNTITSVTSECCPGIDEPVCKNLNTCPGQ